MIEILKIINKIACSMKKFFASLCPKEIEELRETYTEEGIVIDKNMSCISEPTYMNNTSYRNFRSGEMYEIYSPNRHVGRLVYENEYKIRYEYKLYVQCLSDKERHMICVNEYLYAEKRIGDLVKISCNVRHYTDGSKKERFKII
ncbi:MAG: hypothetical protein MJ196_07515 [Treponemataceae bacterium]|nr:hypothetical protein [Treponemataceae bacterium]